MFYRIIFPDYVEQDIDNALEYISRFFGESALNGVKNEIERTINNLSYNPNVYSVYRKDPTQRSTHLNHYPYKFIYYIEEDEKIVNITMFLHDAQDR